jgi:alkanesulfonate monooxygenase SsuD/methylene tetrahydromethanopterin reductase-like flavin-dependent oxidoreductase (luciferase family)
MTEMTGRPLKVGVFIPIVETEMDGGSARWSDILAMARAAEDAGFDSVWVPDHLTIFDPDQEPKGAWEMGSMLGALAAATSRVEIGALVAATSFRNPALLAKMADAIDEISNGRFILGVGSGRHEPEHLAFGYPFGRQVDRFAEALEVLTTLLRTGRADFEGAYYRVRACELRPRGPRPQGPPILIGALGSGPRMLELSARYADLWNAWLTWGDSWPTAVPALREKVDAACAAVGRDPATLGRTVSILAEVPGVPARLVSTAPDRGGRPLSGTPEEMAAALRGFAREGITHVQIICAPNTTRGIAGFAPVLAALDSTSAPSPEGTLLP